MSAFPPLFTSSPFFDILITRFVSNPNSPPLAMKDALGFINHFLCHLHSDLHIRVKHYMEYIHMEPRTLLDSNGMPVTQFEWHHLPIVNDHFVGMCADLKKLIRETQSLPQVPEEYKNALSCLDFEVDRLHSILTIIGRILVRYMRTTQPPQSKRNTHQLRRREQKSVKAAAKSSATANAGARKSKQPLEKKIELELKKDRSVARSNCLSIKSDLPTPTESPSSYSFFYEDERESKKETTIHSDLPTPTESLASYSFFFDEKLESKKEFEVVSTDEEDFDSYFEEILSMASSISDNEAPICEAEWNAFTKYGSSFEDEDQIFSEFTSSSTTIDTNDLLFSYQTIYQKMEEKQQMEMEIITNEIIDEMNYNIAGCLNFFLSEVSH